MRSSSTIFIVICLLFSNILSIHFSRNKKTIKTFSSLLEVAPGKNVTIVTKNGSVPKPVTKKTNESPEFNQTLAKTK